MSGPADDPPPDPGFDQALSGQAVEALQAIARRVDVARRLESGAGQAVLRSIVDAAVTLFGAEAASIALYDPAADRLLFTVAAGEHGQGVVGLAVPSGDGLVGYVFTTGQAIALSDVAADPRFGRSFAEQTEYEPRNIVSVPLLDDEGTIGVLQVLDKRDGGAFTLRDIELAAVFAAQATVAIRASRVERETAELLAAVLHGLLGGGASQMTVDELVTAAVAGLAEGDEGRLWALADQVARLRRVDPGRVDLVADMIDLLARQADRDRASGDRFRGR